MKKVNRRFNCFVLLICMFGSIAVIADGEEPGTNFDSSYSDYNPQFGYNMVERYRRSLFVSAFGGAHIFSFNYEHIFPDSERYFFSMRTGIGLSNRGSSVFAIGSFTPLSRVGTLQGAFAFNYGKGLHNLEIAYGFALYQGSNRRDFHTFPTIGYKIQPMKKGDIDNVYYFRIFSDMLFLSTSMDYQLVIKPPIGISIGGKF